MTPTPANSLLLRQFREFYAEASRLRSQLEHAAPAPALAAPGLALAPTSSAASADPVLAAWHTLLARLRAQADEAARRGGALGARAYQETQYMLAALADELFLSGDWEGRARWPLLETRLFRTQSAGETVFEHIDALLEHPESGYADIAAIYFWALALGFQGKYRGEEGAASLARYRQRLFHLLYRDRSRLFSRERALFPQSYLHNLEEGPGRALPNPRFWLAVLAAVVLLWLGVSQLAWFHITQALDQTITQIEATQPPSPKTSEAQPRLGAPGLQAGASMATPARQRAGVAISGPRGLAALGARAN